MSSDIQGVQYRVSRISQGDKQSAGRSVFLQAHDVRLGLAKPADEVRRASGGVMLLMLKLAGVSKGGTYFAPDGAECEAGRAPAQRTTAFVLTPAAVENRDDLAAWLNRNAKAIMRRRPPDTWRWNKKPATNICFHAGCGHGL
jgi:hypothetical protein